MPLRPFRSALLLATLALACPGGARAQLRPLDPLDPWVWRDRGTVSAEAGVGLFRDQRASLAGTRGTLAELGNFALRWRTGRVVLEAGGTVQRWFDEESRFAELAAGVEPDADGERHDAGDYRISTAVRLTPWNTPARVVLRFGTRIPTTDNRVGLDRDATDFFALLGAGWNRGAGWVWGEGGIGINGTRSAGSEQSDVFAYALAAGWQGARFAPRAELVGQAGGFAGRGNEALAEARAGIRFGRRRWVQVMGVGGLTEVSPSVGVLLSAGWNP